MEGTLPVSSFAKSQFYKGTYSTVNSISTKYADANLMKDKEEEEGLMRNTDQLTFGEDNENYEILDLLPITIEDRFETRAFLNNGCAYNLINQDFYNLLRRKLPNLEMRELPIRSVTFVSIFGKQTKPKVLLKLKYQIKNTQLITKQEEGITVAVIPYFRCDIALGREWLDCFKEERQP